MQLSILKDYVFIPEEISIKTSFNCVVIVFNCVVNADCKAVELYTVHCLFMNCKTIIHI